MAIAGSTVGNVGTERETCAEPGAALHAVSSAMPGATGDPPLREASGTVTRHAVPGPPGGARAVFPPGPLRPDIVLLDLEVPGDGLMARWGMRTCELPSRAPIPASATHAGTCRWQYGRALQGIPAKTSIRPSSFKRSGRWRAAVRRSRRRPGHRSSTGRLTDRGREVPVHIAPGRRHRRTAPVVSAETAGAHVSNLLVKLGVQDRTEAALQTVRRGLADGWRLNELS